MRVGYAMVAAAGPASNLLQSLVFLIILALYIRLAFPPIVEVRSISSRRPCSCLWSASSRMESFSPGQVLLLTLLGRLVIINVGLALFNLLPVGPLDGGGILRGFLPDRWLPGWDRIQPALSIALLVLFFVGFLGLILSPLFWVAENFYVNPLARLILGV